MCVFSEQQGCCSVASSGRSSIALIVDLEQCRAPLWRGIVASGSRRCIFTAVPVHRQTFGRVAPLLCAASCLLSRHVLCHIDRVLFAYVERRHYDSSCAGFYGTTLDYPTAVGLSDR